MYGISLIDTTKDDKCIKRRQSIEGRISENAKSLKKQKEQDETINSLILDAKTFEKSANQPTKGIEKQLMQKLVIPLNCTWKSYFDNVMLIASVINTFSQAYYAAFGDPGQVGFYVEWSIESLFIADFLFCCVQEYKDNETYVVVSNIKKIAKNYLLKVGLFDGIAILPIY